MNHNLDRNSAKILVLGDSGVGKSSLIHLICHSNVLSSVQWTIGCSIDVKIHDNHFLEFWDIGGSRGHKIARSFLYQDYHGIILVFDATNKKSLSNLDEWLAEVSLKTTDRDIDTYTHINVPVIKIATKKDQLPYGAPLSDTSPSPSPTGSFNEDDNLVVEMGNNHSLYNERVHPYKRHLSTSDRLSGGGGALAPLLSTFSNSSLPTTSSYSHDHESVTAHQVIYVNTQDTQSFSFGSRNYDGLNSFFKQVIDRRNKRYYNIR